MEKRNEKFARDKAQRLQQRKDAEKSRSAAKISIIQRETPREPIDPPKEPRPSPKPYRDPRIEELAKMRRALEGCPLPPPSKPKKKVEKNEGGMSTDWQSDNLGPYRMRRDSVGWYKERLPMEMCNFSAEAFKMLTHRDKSARHVQITSIHEMDKMIEDKKDGFPKEEKEELRKKALEVIPADYHNLLRTFSK